MNVYIYGLFDPRTPDTIFYVGQSKCLQSRMGEHKRGRDPVTGKTAKKMLHEGFPVQFKVLEQSDELNAGLREEFWITHLNAVSPLLNNKITEEIKPFEFRTSPIKTLQDLEMEYIQWVLEKVDGNKLVAAKQLGIGRQTLYNKLSAFK